MSEINQAQTQAAVGADRHFPTNSAELHQFIADSFQQLLSVPQNANSIAIATLGAQIKALKDSQELLSRQGAKVVLTRVEYPGCIRAVILAPEVEGEEMSVALTQRISEEEWGAPEGFDQKAMESLARLVLSQAAVPGEMFYITTNAAVENANELASQVIMDRAQAIAQA